MSPSGFIIYYLLICMWPIALVKGCLAVRLCVWEGMFLRWNWLGWNCFSLGFICTAVERFSDSLESSIMPDPSSSRRFCPCCVHTLNSQPCLSLKRCGLLGNCQKDEEAMQRVRTKAAGINERASEGDWGEQRWLEQLWINFLFQDVLGIGPWMLCKDVTKEAVERW